MLVDDTSLPNQFGPSSLTSAQVARTVATVIMSCWEGN